MDTLIQIAQILFILSVLVVLHEFGHYITARMFKVRVEKFYLFMDAGFSLFKKKINDTEWGIGWLPIGGYVKLSGMMDESMDTEQMAQPAQPWEFRSKPAWQRLIIMLGGIIVNIILAWFIFTVMYSTVGQKYISTEKIQENGLAFGEVGQKVGFKNGDKIISIDDIPVQNSFKKMTVDVLLGEKLELLRNGQKQTLIITNSHKKEIISAEGRSFIAPRIKQTIIDSVYPKSEASKAKLQKGDIITGINNIKFTYFDEFRTEVSNKKNDTVILNITRDNAEIVIKSKVDKEGSLGFKNKLPADEEFKKMYLITNKMPLVEAIPAAIKESYSQIKYKAKEFKLLLKPSTGAYTKVKSPIGITRLLPVEWDWEFVWNFMAMFSIALAFMNILPIPGLDGGHALFTIAEMITGKTLSVKAAERVQTVGMIILLSLMALTFGKDIYEAVMDNFFKK